MKTLASSIPPLPTFSAAAISFRVTLRALGGTPLATFAGTLLPVLASAASDDPGRTLSLMLRCAITDRSLFPIASSAHPFQPLVERCAGLAHEAIDLFLIREKDLPAGPLTQLARDILAAIRHANPQTRVLIASRPDIAIAAALDGVHLTSHPAELTPTQIRTLYARANLPPPNITLSCHALKEVRTACTHAPTAILFAPIFGKLMAGAQVTPPAGLDLLAQACRLAAPIPVLALGGITAENTQACLAAGAAGVAAIRFFMLPH